MRGGFRSTKVLAVVCAAGVLSWAGTAVGGAAPAGAEVPSVTLPYVALDLPDIRSMTAANGYLFAAASNTVYVLSTQGEVVTSLAGMSHPDGLVASPDGSRVYVASRDADEIVVLDTHSLSVLERWATEPCPTALALTTALVVYAHNCEDDSERISAVSLHTGRAIPGLTAASDTYMTDLVASGDTVVTGGSPLTSRTVSATGFSDAVTSDVAGLARDIAINPTRPRIATAAGAVHEWDSLTLARRVTHHAAGDATAVAYSHDGRLLAVGSNPVYGHQFALFDTVTQEPMLSGTADAPDRSTGVPGVIARTLTFRDDDSAVHGVIRGSEEGMQWLVTVLVPAVQE